MADAKTPPFEAPPLAEFNAAPGLPPVARPILLGSAPTAIPRPTAGQGGDQEAAASVSGQAISADRGASANVEPARDPHLVDLSPVIRESPPWLVSAVLHISIMILFALLFVGRTMDERLSLDATYSEEIGEQLLEENIELAAQDFEFDEQVITPDDLPEVEDPFALPAVTEVAPLPTEATSMEIPTTIGMALSGRTEGRKEALLKAYGGTAATESAVLLGLKWLQRQQHKNGLWSLQGPYQDGANVENVEAATAMALLAFQGAGYTHQGDTSDPFHRAVAQGWDALLRRQNEDGSFFSQGPQQHRFYTHAQASIALCELYGMTRDATLRRPAQAAIDYLVKTQQPQGGWKYYLDSGNDLSVTGWVVMALQSARMAGLEVPSETLERVRSFLDSVAKDDGSEYAYEPRQGAKLSMTAEGLLCRQYLGWQHNDIRLRKGANILVANLPRWESGEVNTYYWYYATQVCHHMGSHWWNEWNMVMRDLLPAHQEQRGRERGSWDPHGDRWGSSGGRLYMTCLSLYILEVYYRHLPIYKEGLLDL